MNLLKFPSLSARAKIILAGALFGLLAVIATFFLLQRIMDPEALKARLSAQVNARLEGALQTERLEWVWLPTPHLNLHNTSFAGEQISLVVPLAKVSPDWRALFRGQVRIGNISLERPEIRVKEFPASLSEPPDPALVGLDLVIRNGVLLVDANRQWPALQSRDFTLKTLNGRVSISLAATNFELAGTPVGGDHLALSGQYLRDDASYRLKFSCRNFNLKEAFQSFAQGKLEPLDSPLNLTGSLEGRGLEKITGKITGDSSCLLAYPKDKKIPLSCGVVDLSFAMDGDELLLTINEFEMLDPGLNLTGTIRRSVGEKADSAPVWQIELKGEDLDLTRIRGAVLSMWGDNEIVKEVCQYVQGGTAGKASYSFKGTAADLEYVRNMRATAEKIDATIFIPEGELSLTRTRGRMRIENGLLTVDAEEARLGNSRGSNGHLVLGLPEDDFTFMLDVDLDADLAELPPVLARLVEQPPFQEELAKFSEVEGRATGHLRLGDHLKDFKTAVEVTSMRGKGRYAPLAWNFTVDGGGMTIAPPLVKWRDVRGSYGPHTVKKSAGQVRWPEDIILEITQLDAVLAAKELAKEDLSYFHEISGPLRKNITSLDGRIELRNTTIFGKASEPGRWKADTDVAVRDFALGTPFFPEPLKIKEGTAHFSDKSVTVAKATGSIFGDSFTLGAALNHQAFTTLRGKISLQGKVGQGLGQWLKKRHLIAPSLFPQLPFQVESLQIDLKEEKTFARGLIRPDGMFSQPRADVSLEFTKDDPLKMSAHIYDGKEDATITLDFLDYSKETFLFSWKGKLSGYTVDKLLEQKNLLQGRIAGDFQLYLPQDPNKAAFSGELEAKDLRWLLNGEAEHFIYIQDLQLSGVGRDLKVKHLAATLSGKESLEIKGLVSRLADGFVLKLDLVSPSLSRQTLLDFQNAFKRLSDKRGKLFSGNNSRQTPPWNITGTVGFEVANFTSGYKTGEGAPSTLLWQPLKGEITIHPQWGLSVRITNGRLCCLETTGAWFSKPELGNSHFLMRSVCSPLPRFETVMPCLGYPQDIIEGELSLNGRLEGELNNWKDGQLLIESRQGRILRMKLLAKIFSVVNITDLFTLSQQGKGPEISPQGFAYTDLVFKAHVQENELIIDEAVVRGEGLNFFARGKMNLKTFELDVLVMISPFKTIDAIISKVPLVGRIIGGETATLVTFPVGVTGKASDPEVTLLPPGAVGEGLLNIIKRTLLTPFYIMSPILPEAEPAPEKK